MKPLKNIIALNCRKSKPGKVPLVSQVASPNNLKRAFLTEKKRRPSPGTDRQTSAIFGSNLKTNLTHLRQEILSGSYKPTPLLRVHIRGEKKPFYLLSFRDRVVQRAMVNTLAKAWEPLFASCSYAFRPGKSYQDAQKRVLQLCQTHPHIAVIDIEDFFESILHKRLLKRLSGVLHCNRTIDLIKRTVGHGIWPGTGLIRGAILSPLLSNLYLNDFDRAMSKNNQIVRYCDDIALLANSEKELRRSLREARKRLKKGGLRLNSQKMQMGHYNHGFSFLGTFFRKS